MSMTGDTMLPSAGSGSSLLGQSEARKDWWDYEAQGEEPSCMDREK